MVPVVLPWPDRPVLADPGRETSTRPALDAASAEQFRAGERRAAMASQ